MDRTIICVLLYTIAVTAAPKDTVNSDITYVKIQPVTDDSLPPKSPYRESRIENLPLTIPGNVNRTVQDKNSTKTDHADKHVKDVSLNNDSLSNDNQPDNPRRVRSEATTTSYEADTVAPTETVTEGVEELIQQTEEYEARTKAPSPRFLSKLSYFQKDNEVRSSIATNLLERVGKRKYKTTCRCEKIWNCPKLQITVPRCPTEYYLCCG